MDNALNNLLEYQIMKNENDLDENLDFNITVLNKIKGENVG